MADYTKETAGGIAPADISKLRTVLRRLWRFPRSWREARSLGWKFILAFVLFYLVRDILLYIVVPYVIYEGLVSR